MTTRLCECGCLGMARGGRFITGHNMKNLASKSYPAVHIGGNRIETVHRIRAAKALGRPLPKGVVVHHADGTRSQSSQLVICPNQKYHFLLHVRMRVKAAGGDPNTDRICQYCKAVKPMTEFVTLRTRHEWRCKVCVAIRKKVKAA